MKKTTKEFLTLSLILLVTLVAGFGVTAVSFNLFNALTPNQMKVLFAIDVVMLCMVATGVWYFFDSKKAKAKRRVQIQKRHQAQIMSYNEEIDNISEIINLINAA